MVMALVIMAVVTFGFMAWVRLLGQRSLAGEFEEQNARRRLAALNSEAASREYMLMKVMAGASDANGLTLFKPLGSDWSTASAPGWTGAAFETGEKDKVPLNPFSPTWDYTYGKEVVFTAGYKSLAFSNTAAVWTDDSAKFTGSVNSRTPLLGGDLLIAHTRGSSAPALSGNINIFGGFIQFDAAGGYTVRRPAASNASIQLTGAVPSNLPATPLSSGSGYGGALNVISNTTAPVVSLLTKLERERDKNAAINPRASRIVTLAKNVASTDPGVTWTGVVSTTKANVATVTSYESAKEDTPNVVVKDGVSELILKAPPSAQQADAATRQLQVIICDQTSVAAYQFLTTIRLQGTNPRRTLLALKSSAATAPEVTVIVEDSAVSSVWDMMIFAENVKIKFQFSTTSPYKATSLTLYGGIQSDSQLTGPPGANKLDLRLQQNTQGLLGMSPRVGWVEIFLGRDEKL